MKELDFDELDRAVSSLMGQVTGSTDTTDPAPTETPKPDIVEPAAAAPVQSDPPKIDANPPEPAAPTKIVAHSRGKFMDIVTRGSASKPAGSEPASDDDVPADDTAEPTTVMPTSTHHTVLRPSAQFEQSVLEEKAAAEKATPASAPQPEKPADTAADPAVAEAVSSPFLSDAKVEKRPLGANASAVAEVSQPDDQPAEVAPSVDEPASDVPAADDHQLEATTQMPAELSFDVVSVEAGGMISEPPAEDKAVEAAIHEADDPEPPSSIPQQYQTSAAASDEPKATLYDTPSPEVATGKKHHTGIWILLVIVICIVLGAGGGYLAYALKLLG